MVNTFNIQELAAEPQFRKQVIAALDSLAAGTGLLPNSITLDKLQQIADRKLLGNRSGGVADVSEVNDIGQWGT